MIFLIEIYNKSGSFVRYKSIRLDDVTEDFAKGYQKAMQDTYEEKRVYLERLD